MIRDNDWYNYFLYAMRDTGTEPVVSSTLRVFLSEDIRHHTTIDAVPFRRKGAWFLYQFKYALFEKSTDANLDREKSIKLSKIKILTSKYCRLTTKHSWISWQRNVIIRSKKKTGLAKTEWWVVEKVSIFPLPHRHVAEKKIKFYLCKKIVILLFQNQFFICHWMNLYSYSQN